MNNNEYERDSSHPLKMGVFYRANLIDLTSLRPRKVEAPLVSIVIPCYNVEQYIDQCIMSILDNGYPNVEVICVDDHSTDNTVEHIQNLMKSHSSNVIQLYDNGADHNIYGGACRNIGMEHATGKYIYFCDSDDYILPGLFSECVEWCEDVELDFCCFGFKVHSHDRCVRGLALNAFDINKIVIDPRKDMTNMFTSTSVVAWNKVYRMDFVRENGIHFMETKNSNDQTFTLSGYVHAKRVHVVNRALYVHRERTSTSVQADRMNGGHENDLVDAISRSYDIVKPEFSTLGPHYLNYVHQELSYMLRRKCKVTPSFMESIVRFLSTVPGSMCLNRMIEDVRHNCCVKGCADVDSISDDAVIVSFATYKERIQNEDTYQFLESIVGQKFSEKFHIVANMFQKDFDEMSEKMKTYLREHGIEVMTSPFNWKSNLKHIMVMRRYSGRTVVTVDDDVVYHPDMLQLLWNCHNRHPREIICGRAQKVIRDSNGMADLRSTFERVKTFGESGQDVMAIGCSGVLYPPEYTSAMSKRDCGREIMDMDVLIRDDYYLHFVAAQNLIPTRLVEDSPHQLLNDIGCLVERGLSSSSGSTALWRTNVTKCQNRKSTWMLNIAPPTSMPVFATVNAGTNTFTNITVKSILKYHPRSKVFVVNVVPDRRFQWLDDNVLPSNVEVVEGISKDRLNLPTIDVRSPDTGLSSKEMDVVVSRMEQGDGVPVYFSGDTHHSTNIQLILDMLDHDFILVDSDAPLTRPADNMVDRSKVTVASIDDCPISEDTMILNARNCRFEPYIQYFNTKMIKDNGVWFFRNDMLKKFIGLAARWKPDPLYGDELTSDKWTFLWWTGNIFYKQIMDRGLPFRKIDYRQQVNHFRNGTWNHRKDEQPKKIFYSKYRGLFKNSYLIDEN